jgi:NADH dehydrogenase (ubiquinone) flavoprotein 2
MLSKLFLSRSAAVAQRALPRALPCMSASLSRTLHTSRSAASGGMSVHKPETYNNDDTPFEFNEDSLKQIEWCLSKFPKNYKQSACIPVLYIAQEQEGANNWLTLTAMNKVAEVLDMPPIRVYEVASFYTMFNRTPVGKYHIQLCGTTPCMITGAQDIKKAIMDFADIKEGEISKDGLFTVTEVECLGACVNAPMIQVNNKEFYEDLTPASMIEIMEAWKEGKTPKIGECFDVVCV